MFFKSKKESLPSTEEMQKIVREAKLSHIAFIMDGNGRWANAKGLPREAGHGVGAKTFKKAVTLCRDWGIDTVTTYAFSTENWKRPPQEVKEIMRLLDSYIKEAEDDNEKNHIRYIFLGDKARLGEELSAKCRYLEELTKNNALTLNIALNYGGRAELVNAVNSLIAQGKTSVTEEEISSKLYTAESPDPDLIIRTGGEIRLSNFLLWQSQYSELYFTDCLWPDFGEEELILAIQEFSRRKRRYGGV